MSDSTQAAREAAERIAEKSYPGFGVVGSSEHRRLLAKDIKAELLAFRQAALEEAAQCAKSHRGAGLRRRKERGIKLGHLEPGTQIEIRSEERGEDIAAYEIEAAIRRLASPAPKEEPHG